jgi:adenylyltransferase/sulfurtransferase
MAALNPDVHVDTHPRRLRAAGLLDLIAQYDVVADGSDNFATRYLLNDACYLARRPLVSAAIMRTDGQLATFRAFERGPCYRCVYGPQPPEAKQSCADVGVLAVLPGVLGTLQATEVLKEILDLGDGLTGRLLLYDALGAQFRSIATQRDPACDLCGENPRITALTDAAYGGAACAA